MTAAKKPATKATPASGAKLSVRQVRSGIGFPVRQKATLRSMGLGKIGRVRQFPDNPAVRGMIQSIIHLVEIVPEETRS